MIQRRIPSSVNDFIKRACKLLLMFEHHAEKENSKAIKIIYVDIGNTQENRHINSEIILHHHNEVHYHADKTC